jgi:hypothetical protein
MGKGKDEWEWEEGKGIKEKRMRDNNTYLTLFLLENIRQVLQALTLFWPAHQIS